MNGAKAFIFRFYLPIIISFFLIVLIVFTPKFIPNQDTATLIAEFKIGLLGFKIPLATWVENAWLIKTIILFLVVTLFLYGITINFSKYFPTNLIMDTYFDIPGIKRTLSIFNNNDLEDINIPQDWDTRLSEYDNDIILSLRKNWGDSGLPDIMSDDQNLRDLIHASGEASFFVDKIGILTYKIVKSEGRLNYEVDLPRKQRRKFKGEFHLRDTGENYIRPKIFEIIKSPSLTLKPQFMQVLKIDSWPELGIFDHLVIGATKVTLLPIPTFSDTIYFWRSSNGEWIPIGYSIYH
ncbi:MAG: hypothetical protein ABTQ25_12330 [Nitrosomonas ureae]